MYDTVLWPLRKPAVKVVLTAVEGSPLKGEHLRLLGQGYQYMCCKRLEAPVPAPSIRRARVRQQYLWERGEHQIQAIVSQCQALPPQGDQGDEISPTSTNRNLVTFGLINKQIV